VPRGYEDRLELLIAALAGAALTPAYDNAYDDGQSSSTRESSYRLSDDWDYVEAPQRWDQSLKDFCAYNSAYSSPDDVSGRTCKISLK
jgi:hypothetical protein